MKALRADWRLGGAGRGLQHAHRGGLFSLEEVMGDMHAPVLGSIVLSSATSWIVLHLLLGDEPLFHVPAYQLVHPVEFLFYAVLGVVGGLVSVAFVKLLLWLRKHFRRCPSRPVVAAGGGRPAGRPAGLVLCPQVLGVGYGYVSQALNGQMVIGMMALLVVLKVVATATCYASGNAGGIFGPSLFIGAMMGGAVGGVAHLLLPDYTGSVGAYALVGMGAAFAGIIRVPLTSRHHDLRDHPRLLDHRAADDRQPDQLLHLQPSAAGADLRSLAASGWRLSALRRARPRGTRHRRRWHPPGLRVLSSRTIRCAPRSTQPAAFRAPGRWPRRAVFWA